MTSQLCALPEETLLEILSHLDPSTLQCLRRTSRLFLRLFSAPRFSHLHNTDTISRALSNAPLPILPWARPSPVVEFQACRDKSRICTLPSETQHHTSALFKFDRAVHPRCASCRAYGGNSLHSAHQIAVDLVTKRLHCSSCEATHPRAYFSAAARSPETSDKDRKCIGHEGFIRLCEHEIISWEKIDKAWKKHLAKQPDQASPPNPDQRFKVPLIICKHESHHSWHHIPAPIQGGMPPPKSVQPSAHIEYTPDGVRALVLQWTGHCTILERQPLPGGRLMPAQLARDLDGFRLNPGSVAGNLVPQPGPGNLLFRGVRGRGFPPEMRCFDPSKCSCLDWGREYQFRQIAGGCALLSDAYDTTVSGSKSCRQHEELRFDALKPSTPSPPPAIVNNPFAPPGPAAPPSSTGIDSIRAKQREEIFKAHSAQTLLGQVPGLKYGWDVAFGPCVSPTPTLFRTGLARITRCLEARYRRVIPLPATPGTSMARHPPTALPDGFMEAIHPDSYHLRADAETHSVSWCMDGNMNCVNYAYYSERPIMRACVRIAGAVADWFPFAGKIPMGFNVAGASVITAVRVPKTQEEGAGDGKVGSLSAAGKRLVKGLPAPKNVPWEMATRATASRAAMANAGANAAIPEADTPDTTTPDATMPDTVTPDAITPGATMPDATTPDNNTPDTSTSDAIMPDTTTPNAITLDAVTRMATTSQAPSRGQTALPQAARGGVKKQGRPMKQGKEASSKSEKGKEDGGWRAQYRKMKRFFSRDIYMHRKGSTHC